MAGTSYGLWDMILKSVTAGLGIAGALWAIYGYLDGKKRDRTTRFIEAQKPFSSKRQDLYFAAVSAAAIIASEVTPERRSKAEATFWRLYWGTMAVVEDKAVEGAMVAFGKQLYESPNDLGELRRRALSLARTCRAGLAESWQVDLPELPDRPIGLQRSEKY
jgi:hypothetical protein